MSKKSSNHGEQIVVKDIIYNLHDNMGYSREEAVRFCKDSLLERFKKNFFPALDYLQEKYRYKKTSIDFLYLNAGRWYTELYKREITENIAFNTIIRISTVYEMTPGELIDFIISFDKKKK